jgi:hypothetical protein
VLAAGQLSLDEAISYITTLKNIRAVVVGVSTVNHAVETFQKLSKFFPADRQV